jgi:DNA-binding FadR family transcriptional regulator
MTRPSVGGRETEASLPQEPWSPGLDELAPATAGDRLDAVAPAAHAGVLADTAVRIGLAVDLGLLQPDERLQGEDELAATFGVSRMTVRRALQLLSDRGVLVRRRGRGGGTFVAADPPRGVLREFESYRTVSGEVFDLIDNRLVIECGAAYLAAGKATPGDVDRLRGLVREMDAARTWTAFRAVDPRFHLAVASIAGSNGAVGALADVLGRLIRFYVPYPISYLHASNREHEALVEAIAAHDRMAAVAVIDRHISELRHTVFVKPERPTRIRARSTR